MYSIFVEKTFLKDLSKIQTNILKKKTKYIIFTIIALLFMCLMNWCYNNIFLIIIVSSI